jgi:small GTP-binding protein
MESKLKLAVIGWGDVGKTSIISQFTNKSDLDFTFYKPTTETNEDSYKKQIQIDKINYDLQIIDTAGQEEYDSLKLIYMPKPYDGYLLVYSVKDKSSFENLEILKDEILKKRKLDFLPMVLVGNMTDLESERVVSTEEGNNLANKWGIKFFETSSKIGENLDESFIQLVREVRKFKDDQMNLYKNEKKNEKNCLIS